MMRVVFIEGYVNDRVRGVLREVFGTDEVSIIGYCQEGGWWSQMAYVDSDKVLERDDLRRIQLDVSKVEEDVFGDNPVALLYDRDYLWIFDQPIQIDPYGDMDTDDVNVYGKPFLLCGWVVGGNDDDTDDVYEC